MTEFAKPLINATHALLRQLPVAAAQRRASPARALLETAQQRAAHNPQDAADLRRAAVAQLSLVR